MKFVRTTRITYFQGILGATDRFPDSIMYGEIDSEVTEDVIDCHIKPRDLVDIPHVNPKHPNTNATISITYSEYVEKTPVVKQPFKKEFVFDDIPF